MSVDRSDASRTWHFGVVAQWWAEFNVGGPELPFFRSMIERYGQPALDVACGTGRLLLPYLEDGLDVDGCDVSPDMVGHARRLAARKRLTPHLFEQAMHELDLPRRYRTIFVCGGFGIGGNRQWCREALRRFHHHLEPGGALVLDVYAPYANPSQWEYWQLARKGDLPQPWGEPASPRPASDGSGLVLLARLVDFDPLEQVATLEMRGQRFREGRLEVDETYTLKEVLYLPAEVTLLLESAGFDRIEILDGYTGATASRTSSVHVFVARKP